MEFTGARIHPEITNAAYATLQGTFVENRELSGAKAAKAHPYMGWVRPLAVRCISGHSNGAVDLELVTIPITDKVMEAVGGAWHITSRYNLLWIAKHGLLPGGLRRKRMDIHFFAIPPGDPRWRSTFTYRFTNEGEQGMAIYVPITILKEMGARLASNGVILCCDKVPYTAIHAIFELKNAREMGPRIQSPSLVDEYVCETMQGEDCMKVSERYVLKVADAYKSDIEIPFTYRNNVALILQKWRAN